MTETDLPQPDPTPVAVVTGASRGLGLALTDHLTQHGWHVVVDARDATALARAVEHLPPGRVTAVPGDVADAAHRERLARAVADHGRLELLVNNASTLGPTPLPSLADLDPHDLRQVLEVNAVAPLALARMLLPLLRRSHGTIVNISSDAAVGAYPGWGAYGAAKAALDQLGAVLAVEEPDVRVYSVDPGDMATEMHRAAVPEEDLTTLPTPGTVVPHLLRTISGDLPGGRYAVDLTAEPAAGPTAEPAAEPTAVRSGA